MELCEVDKSVIEGLMKCVGKTIMQGEHHCWPLSNVKNIHKDNRREEFHYK
jgi:hypothetical protein